MPVLATEENRLESIRNALPKEGLFADKDWLIYQRPAGQWKYPYAFDVPLDSWYELVMANAFYDQAGYELLGLAGALFAVPIAASLAVIVDEFHQERLLAEQEQEAVDGVRGASPAAERPLGASQLGG